MTARSLLRRVLGGGVLATLALALVAPTASAHDVLIDSDPAEGATLTQSPPAVTLTFNNSPLAVGSAIELAEAGGATVAEVEGTAEGDTVTFELTDELTSGDYEAHWRVASSDGHPIDGVIAFSVELPEPQATEEPAAEPAETAAPEETAEPATAAAQEPTEAATTEAETTTSGLSSLPLWLRIAIGLAALASVVGLVVGVVRRRRGDRL